MTPRYSTRREFLRRAAGTSALGVAALGAGLVPRRLRAPPTPADPEPRTTTSTTTTVARRARATGGAGDARSPAPWSFPRVRSTARPAALQRKFVGPPPPRDRLLRGRRGRRALRRVHQRPRLVDVRSLGRPQLRGVLQLRRLGHRRESLGSGIRADPTTTPRPSARARS